MKFVKTLVMWILALQMLNMSICCEVYWYYYNDGSQIAKHKDLEVDPTETIVEWLVEMKLGQQNAFTYDQHNIDPKNSIKAFAHGTDLLNEWGSMLFLKKKVKIHFTDLVSIVEPAPLEILSPPPDLGFC